MGCIVEFGKTPVRIDFCKNKNFQKIWLEVLFKYYQAMDYERLAYVLDVPLKTIRDVHLGLRYLDDEAAANLAGWFLILMSE